MDWFPWYPALYRADTLDLSLEQDGAYRRLLDHYMETRLPLPDNDTALSRIIGISINDFQAIAEPVKSKFKTNGDHLHNKRCDIELNRQDSLSKKRSNVAKAAHKKRNKNKDKQAIAEQDVGNCGNTGQDKTEDKKEEDSCSVQADANHKNHHEGEINSIENPIFKPDPEAAKDLLGKVPVVIFPTLKKLGPTPRKYPEQFDRFWLAFPKRPTDTKAEAYTAWLKAEKAVSVDQLQSAAQTYAEFCRAKDHESKLVKTWVNAEGWTADYATGGGSDQPQTPYQAALVTWYAAKEAAVNNRMPVPPKPQLADFQGASQ